MAADTHERTHQNPVIIIGAGLSGLACALTLHQAGIPFQILEASDRPGGKLKTDTVDGFMLDHGFQVLLSEYPEAKRFLDYEALDLKPFYPGALVRTPHQFCKVGDPWRATYDIMETLVAPVSTFLDKLRVAFLCFRINRLSFDDILQRREVPSLTYLKWLGFSNTMIDRFWKPFLSGIFLEPDLETSSRKLEWVMKHFISGLALLPGQGMEAIPRQMAAKCPDGSIRTHARVVRIEPNQVTLESGETLQAAHIVVAADKHAACKLLGVPDHSKFRAVSCLYFSAPATYVREPLLVLNGSGKGLINTLCLPSNVNRSYAPGGQSLVSVSVLGTPDMADDALRSTVQAQLQDWFGKMAADWKHLKTYHIKHALPDQTLECGGVNPTGLADSPVVNVTWCGDWLDTASIDGALRSGRLAGEAIIQKLG